MLIPIILCGGAGTRLWPLSRESLPKPFVPLPDGETLLAGTARRALAIEGAGPLITITNRDYYFAARDVYATLGDGAPGETAFLLEPFARNTAGAVALGALYAAERFGADVPLLVMPADHLIRRHQDFARAALRAAEVARRGYLVTFGIRPTHPETGFGYIECGVVLQTGDTMDDSATPAQAVTRFIEKPPLADAQRFLLDGTYVWNAGIFCFTADVLLAALAAHAPDVLDAARGAWDARSTNSLAAVEFDPVSFARMPDISLDYAVMERASNTAVMQADFDWSDVGSWQALSDLMPADGDGNRGHGEHVSIGTHRTFVHAGDRIVATVGVDNLVIVETADAVLVAHRDHLQRVKEVVSELKSRGHEAYRTHRTVSRPWGNYTVLQEGPRFKIKRIEVKPGAALSLQMHEWRSEHWVVVAGEARVTRGAETFALAANESAYIPARERHRLENLGSVPLSIIEVQCGDYVGEDDIVRFDDRYGRSPA
ncbi:MAG: mannose-1-phosphate guanylyltransferase/mannose-6-phosphate isomerase [Casimicrobiaceae bacterium]